MIGTALVAATIGVQLISGTLGLQAGLTVLLLAPEMYGPLRQVGQQFHASTDASTASKRIFQTLDGPPAITRSPRPRQAMGPAEAPVELHSVDYEYPQRKGSVLSGIDMRLEPGLITALLGHSGAGKSTIVRLLMRLADPTCGRITCGGVDLRELDLERWRSQIAWVPQRPTLFTGTIAQNIALCRPRATRTEIQRAACAAGAEEFIGRLPHDLQTQVGEGARRLSAGQAQRIALARAFLADRPLLLLDEPTSHLDDGSTQTISETIRALAHGRTTLLIVHHPLLTELADRLQVLRSGHLTGRPLEHRHLAPNSTAKLGDSMTPKPTRRCCTSPGRGPASFAAWLSVALATGAALAAIALLGSSGYLISRAAQRPPILALMVTIVAVRAFGLTRAVLRYGERLASHDLALRQLSRLRQHFYRSLVPLIPSGLENRSGDLLSRFVADIDTLKDLYLRVVIPGLVSLLVLITATLAAWLMLPAAGLTMLLSLTLAILLLPWLSSTVASRAARRQAPARAHLTSELIESIDGVGELVLAGQAHARAGHLSESDDRLARIARSDAIASCAAATAGGVLAGFGVLALLLVTIPAVHSGALSGVLLAALVFLMLAAYENILPLSAAARSLRVCSTAAVRLQEIALQPPAVEDPLCAPELSGIGELRCEHISFGYEPGQELVLDDLQMRIGPGEHVAVTGPSGIGKSTLAELLVRFNDPTTGRLTLDGIDLRELTQSQVRAAVLLCAQDCHVFNTTIRENLLIARRAATDRQISTL